MRHIKKSLLKLAALLFLFSATQVYGGAYVMPVNTIPKGDQATTTMEIIEWTEEEGIPNPCYGTDQCYVGPDVQYREFQPGMYGSCMVAGVCLTDAHRYPTTAGVMRAYKKRFGIPKRVTFDIITADSECVGLFYTYSQHIRTGAGSAQRFPNSTCNKMPPPNQYCEIYVPSEIAYGELIASEVNNTSQTVNGYFKCALASGEIQLHAKSIDGESKVYFDANRQMYATLQINDKDATGGVNVIANGKNESTSFTLKSTLHTLTPPKAGKYEGTAIVYLTYL
ncbi:pilus assembly protein [Xenorhabdus sp. Reich]|uniref:Pilus assembly protein n=1 Tax=Xenorhabdus littoralis TaxID=2582835 RepID=A0ABU4SJY5_9GAMM|nr:pilus assembly protein [Xenorhabdus sp. Reich]MDX7998968.1 pilus assembly protein [Xenorhabdus sp. Reich]